MKQKEDKTWKTCDTRYECMDKVLVGSCDGLCSVWHWNMEQGSSREETVECRENKVFEEYV